MISGATSNTYLASPTTTNSYAYSVEDSGSPPSTVCSNSDVVTVDVLTAEAPTASNSIIYTGQISLQTANPSGGEQPYVAYQWYTNYGSSVACPGTGNMIIGATSSTYLASPTTTNSYAYSVGDSESPQVVQCSASDVVAIAPFGYEGFKSGQAANIRHWPAGPLKRQSKSRWRC